MKWEKGYSREPLGTWRHVPGTLNLVEPSQKWHLRWDLKDEEKLARLRREKFQRQGLTREKAFKQEYDGSCRQFSVAQITVTGEWLRNKGIC